MSKILLSDEEIYKLLICIKGCPLDTVDEQVSTILKVVDITKKAQMKKVVGWLRENGAHFCDDEMEAVEHKGYYELDWSKFEELLKEIEDGSNS